MECAWDLGIRNLKIHTDSTCVVQILTRSSDKEH
ncbi:hypothetical protein LINPERPRIM_LOCUS35376 [Linum perenne]